MDGPKLPSMMLPSAAMQLHQTGLSPRAQLQPTGFHQIGYLKRPHRKTAHCPFVARL